MESQTHWPGAIDPIDAAAARAGRIAKLRRRVAEQQRALDLAAANIQTLSEAIAAIEAGVDDD